MEAQSGSSVFGRLSRRAVILCALLVLSVAGGVLLTRVMPHSNIGVFLFLGGIFFLLPLTIGEVQGIEATHDEDERVGFVYGSVNIDDNPMQIGVDTTSVFDK